MKKVVFLGAVLLLVFTCSSCFFPRSYTIKGYVYEAYQKSPLPGITVKAMDKQCTTSQDGFYSIINLTEKKVPILVGNHQKYSDLTDTLLLDQKVNHRDFILEAKHPLGIDLSEYHEPVSYQFSYRSMEDKDLLTSIITGKMVPIDESLSIVGQFLNPLKKWQPVEVVQIGLSFFEKDDYGNWNETTKPNGQALQFRANAGDMIKMAYHFFEDPLIEYVKEPGEFLVEGKKTALFHVKHTNNKESEKQYDIYLLEEGDQRGQVKKVVMNINDLLNAPNKTTMTLLLSQWNEVLEITPPEITQ